MPEFKRPASAAGRGEELAVIAPNLKRYRSASSSELVPKVTQASIRRLARRAGVKRISGDFYADAERGLREVLSRWIRDIAVITEYSRRRTTTLSDVLLVLKKHGRCGRCAVCCLERSRASAILQGPRARGVGVQRSNGRARARDQRRRWRGSRPPRAGGVLCSLFALEAPLRACVLAGSVVLLGCGALAFFFFARACVSFLVVECLLRVSPFFTLPLSLFFCSVRARSPLYGFEERQRRRRLTAPLQQESLNASFQRVVARRRAGGKGLAPRSETSIGERVRREAVVAGGRRKGDEDRVVAARSEPAASQSSFASANLVSAVSEVSGEEEIDVAGDVCAAARLLECSRAEEVAEAPVPLSAAVEAAVRTPAGKGSSGKPSPFSPLPSSRARAGPSTPSASVASSARLLPPTPGGTPAARPRGGQRTLDALFRTPPPKLASQSARARDAAAEEASEASSASPSSPPRAAPSGPSASPEASPRAPLSPASSSCGPAAPLTPERAERIQSALAAFREAASARGDGGGVSTPSLHRWVLAELAAGGEAPCTMGDLEVVLDALDARAAVVLATDPDTDLPTVYFC